MLYPKQSYSDQCYKEIVVYLLKPVMLTVSIKLFSLTTGKQYEADLEFLSDGNTLPNLAGIQRYCIKAFN